MIVAIEGPSAAGKTTWCRSHVGGNYVEETPEDIGDPAQIYSDPIGAAKFWVEYEVKRWNLALAIEKERGVAICDTDPLRLYHSWSLWQSGVISSKLFEEEVELYRCAMRQQRVGFADIVILADAPLQELRRRAQADSSRRRHSHELFMLLLPWTQAWWRIREQVLTGGVRAAAETVLENRPVSPHRYDARAFDLMVEKARNWQ